MIQIPDDRPLRKRPGETWRDCLLRRARAHGMVDAIAADFDNTRKWTTATERYVAMGVACDKNIGPEPRGPFAHWRKFVWSRVVRGTRRQRRLTAQRAMQADRWFWRNEGRALLLQGHGGSIFGSTSDTSATYGVAP